MTTSSDSMTMVAHVSNQWLANVWAVGRSPFPPPRGPPAGRCDGDVVELRFNVQVELVDDSPRSVRMDCGQAISPTSGEPRVSVASSR